MRAENMLQDARVRVSALVCACFLLGSAGWLAWLYRIMALAEPAMVDLYTMVLGYLAQVLGIGAYMAACHKGRGSRLAPVSAMVAIGLYVALMEPATMSAELVPTLAFGYAMNVACGYFQGHYLICLAKLVEPAGRGIVFGGGYAVSTLATWILSEANGGSLASGAANVLVCLLLALIAIALVNLTGKTPSECDSPQPAGEGSGLVFSGATRSLVVLAGTAVVMASLVKNAGFSFPASDLSGEVNLELSRLFYGVGLVLAGVVADRDRRYAMLCCAASLAAPFLMLALSGANAMGITLWALGYLLFGFFSVWRVLLFADLAASSGRLWLAGAGLLLGRVGDIMGTALYLALGETAVALIAVSTALFVVTAAIMYMLFVRLYAQAQTEGSGDEIDSLEEFCRERGLSAREKDVLRLVVAGMSNSKVARELSISDATVKFHMRNILKKTGQANRIGLIELYNSSASKN